MSRADLTRRGALGLGLGFGGLALAGCSFVPAIPGRPDASAEAALGWIRHENGRYILSLPRAEMGQNIATALKRIACDELGAGWEEVTVELQDTGAMEPVRGTVGSDSVKDYALPLAQACATLRDARAAGRAAGAAEARRAGPLRAFAGAARTGPTPLEQGREIVTGAPLFAADIRLEGMVFGRVLRAAAPQEAETRLRAADRAAASAVPGFVALAEDDALAFGGVAGLGIVARTPGALDRIEAALAAEWEIVGPAETDIEAALDVDARLAAGGLSHRVASDRIDAGAPWDVDLRFDLPLAAHGQIEPRAAVARVEDGVLEVWTGSQDVFFVRDVLERAVGGRVAAVRVRACRIGGAFGGRTIPTVESEAAVLALAVGAPVKVQWTRPQEYALGFHRPPVSRRLRARITDGAVTDWHDAFVSSHILFTSAVLPGWLQSVIGGVAGDGGVARGAEPPYRFARKRIEYDLVRLPVHTGPWRGLGAGPNAFAIESVIDEAALAAGQDPLAFRLGMIDDPRLAAVLLRAAETAGWPAPASPRVGRRTGRGIACGIYKNMSYAAAVAEVAVADDGRVQVTKFWCAHDCGLVIDPGGVRAQCEGNLIWGMGMVLGDALAFAAGRVTAESFAEAPIPTMAEAPEIEIDLIRSDAPPTGAGETAMVAAPGAVANAVRAATGRRPLRLPLDPRLFRL